MDANLAQRRLGLEDKIPDYQKTLDMVEYLQERRVGTPSICLCDEYLFNVMAGRQGQSSR